MEVSGGGSATRSRSCVMAPIPSGASMGRSVMRSSKERIILASVLQGTVGSTVSTLGLLVARSFASMKQSVLRVRKGMYANAGRIGEEVPIAQFLP